MSRKDHLVTLLRCHYWLGGGGSKARVTMSLYITFFFDGVPSCVPGGGADVPPLELGPMDDFFIIFSR